MTDKILVVDDEHEIADLIEVYLKNENYEVFKFYSPKDALKCAGEVKIDLAILDIMMPEMDGFTLCQKIRDNHTFPIIMLTAKDSETDKITGLTFGADDYITKPFRPVELVARVKAQLRRYKRYNTAHTEEFTILQILLENKGNVINAEDLFHRIWKDEYYSKSNNTITVHIRHLREKLNDSVDHPKYIKTIWGVGYKIEK